MLRSHSLLVDNESLRIGSSVRPAKEMPVSSIKRFKPKLAADFAKWPSSIAAGYLLQPMRTGNSGGKLFKCRCVDQCHT
jgi:hypothetical protein